MLSDQEVICAFMEPRPEPNTHGGTHRSARGWWFWSGTWEPRTLTLDALWEVEEKLKQRPRGQRAAYYEHQGLLSEATDGESWHATPAQKIAALASVLRPLVEQGGQR
jgi:hypothetical protein